MYSFPRNYLQRCLQIRKYEIILFSEEKLFIFMALQSSHDQIKQNTFWAATERWCKAAVANDIQI